MRDEAVGELVGALCDNYKKDPTDDLVTLWWNSFHEVSQPIIDAALADFVACEAYMPTVAKFREYVDKHSRIAKRIAPRGTECQTCEGSGWKESTVVETATGKRPTKGPDGKMDGPMEAYEFTYPPGVYPCPECRPGLHDRWRSQFIPEALRNKPTKAPDLLPANPRMGLAQARAALAAADQLTKSTEEL